MNMDIDRNILRKIKNYWPDEDPLAILDILNAYGTGEMERGKTRVHLAILKCSDGHLDRLSDLVATAKRDWRDIVAFAEYPEQMKLGFVAMRELTPAQRKALKKRDAKQYAEWLVRG